MINLVKFVAALRTIVAVFVLGVGGFMLINTGMWMPQDEWLKTVILLCPLGEIVILPGFKRIRYDGNHWVRDAQEMLWLLSTLLLVFSVEANIGARLYAVAITGLLMFLWFFVEIVE